MLKSSLVTLLLSIQQKRLFFYFFFLICYKDSDTQPDILCLLSIFQADEVKKTSNPSGIIQVILLVCSIPSLINLQKPISI